MKRKTKSRTKAPKVYSPEVLPAEDEAEVQAESEDVVSDEESEPSETEIASSLPATIAQPELEPELAAVSATDPLRRFLEEVRRYPLLTPEQEYELATRLKNSGDIAAAKALVSANLRLVIKIAFEYRSMYSNVLDLIQEGNIGLMKAVSKFDPDKGARLGYYASWWIRSYMLKYLLDNFRLVKIGTTQAQKKLFYHLMREKERLEAQGKLAGPKLLAERLNVREKDVVEMEQRLSGKGAEMSLDLPVNTGEGGRTASHLDLLVDGAEGADEKLARQQLLDLLKEKLPEFEEGLNDKERKLLQERLLAEEPKTLQEVADLYGLTRERARQIEAKVILKLREFLRDSF
ncbi:MAG: RNA polymerase factor sigma-32 [Bdellovibrionota bacterium]